MDSTGSGQYIPVRLKNGEPDAQSRNSRMAAADFSALLAEAADIAETLAEGLLSGDKAVRPFASGGHDPCENCDMKDACPRPGAKTEEE